ncbi:MAG TPA: hydrogenase formation protein HypD [Bacillota bacterium]|nr:hydrogenase formation protein HypD [Bacillota bacterium]
MNRNNNPFITRFFSEYAELKCTLMEVCGTHTNVIRKAGIHRLLPPGIRLLSGPGCPVCVTGSGYIEQAISLSRRPEVIISSFGDLLKVPGNTGTLSEARAKGGQIRVVYSPLDAVVLARSNPAKEVVFLGVGFETTAPIIALAVQEARESGLKNFSVLPALKILNPALRALLSDASFKLHGLIAPGHLSVIVGADSLAFLPEEFKLPTVITGFQTPELWLGLEALARQIKEGSARLENKYSQVVTPAGNPAAQKLIRELFSPEFTEWRGLGGIEASGFGFQEAFQDFDARRRFAISPIPSEEPGGCLCGQILLGKAEPEDCPHFDAACNPEHPVGPCMVSTEGACAAHYYYRDIKS